MFWIILVIIIKYLNYLKLHRLWNILKFNLNVKHFDFNHKNTWIKLKKAEHAFVP